MPRILNFYMDDSGTRAPNREPLRYNKRTREFFALGGVLVAEETEAAARKLYGEFCARWSIDYPLHSVEIRHCRERFFWLGRDRSERNKFMSDLSRTLLSLDILGLACVIDRPGYDARYREQYGSHQWHLCQTAFSIAVERAAKFARDVDRKLRVLPERTSRVDDDRLIRYYDALRTGGPPFAKTSSAQYSPLTATEFRETLYEIRFKTKASPMAQVADLYLWPIALAGYEPRNRAYIALQSSGRLIENHLSPSQIAEAGSKYSCFELVRRHRRRG